VRLKLEIFKEDVDWMFVIVNRCVAYFVIREYQKVMGDDYRE
jgi:hypothetical protein